MAASHKHLKSGSQCPALKEHQLRLYSMRFSPNAQRVKLVLTAKKIPYEEVLIDLRDKPAWFLPKNSTAQIPVLEWIDRNMKKTRTLPESLIISDYLDELRPERRLHPTDPFLKAEQNILVSRFSSVITPFFTLVFKTGQEEVDNLNKSLIPYEAALQSKFFGGAKPAMVDYMIWPYFERLSVLKSNGFVLNADGKLPKLAAWVQAMEADEAVRSTKIPEAVMIKFVETVKKDAPDYDIE